MGRRPVVVEGTLIKAGETKTVDNISVHESFLRIEKIQEKIKGNDNSEIKTNKTIYKK